MMIDALHVYAISGMMRYPAARELARKYQPEALFPDPAARWTALACTSTDPPAKPPPISIAGRVSVMLAAIDRTELPNSEEWAVYLVQRLIDEAGFRVVGFELNAIARSMWRGDCGSREHVERRIGAALDMAYGRNGLRNELLGA